MPRSASPSELSPLERTALWVQAQAQQSYDQSRPSTPTRTSIQTSSSNRTTSSTEESYLKSPVAPPLISPYAMPAASLTQRPRYDSRSRRASLPFPQSPPGSGYPVPLEVASPRRPEAEDKKIPRPSLRKQRRPSLIEQIITLGTPSQRRREDSGKKGQT
ncbi:hypothetical protein C8Q70DRAFT_68573 [Cubamyces menziesii]|uniref:Uncharacterized protein n=1 Tax=Trametes cubensis TaxID=1111947 RepID=A0AAD7TJQ2_9APHY|nr:hypothetical protein C8Q70DRAFT_68573 [Cubamyces menziesii]KAJ8463095.1 hypothetical protein ONZ51_g10468 [Trametes cubensis]